jgi:phosphoglycolate phosphatase
MPFARARNAVSHGAIGLIRLGFGLGDTAAVDAGQRQEFLDLYTLQGNYNSRLFITLNALNDVVSSLGAVWGVVTNKPSALTGPLLDQLGIADAAGTVVSGDTLPESKPHPAPLLHAAAALGIDPADCIYLGDAKRDIEAGRAAGMRTVATSWGYIRPGEDVSAWRPDACVEHPRKIAAMLRAFVGFRP